MTFLNQYFQNRTKNKYKAEGFFKIFCIAFITITQILQKIFDKIVNFQFYLLVIVYVTIELFC